MPLRGKAQGHALLVEGEGGHRQINPELGIEPADQHDAPVMEDRQPHRLGARLADHVLDRDAGLPDRREPPLRLGRHKVQPFGAGGDPVEAQ